MLRVLRGQGGYEADAAIIPEPTFMVICPATRGGKHIKITVEGKPGLGYSGEELINPVYDMGKIVEAGRIAQNTGKKIYLKDI